MSAAPDLAALEAAVITAAEAWAARIEDSPHSWADEQDLALLDALDALRAAKQPQRREWIVTTEHRRARPGELSRHGEVIVDWRPPGGPAMTVDRAALRRLAETAGNLLIISPEEAFNLLDALDSAEAVMAEDARLRRIGRWVVDSKERRDWVSSVSNSDRCEGWNAFRAAALAAGGQP